MPVFSVTVKEVYLQPYLITARNKQNAIQKVTEGDGNCVEDAFRYSYSLDPSEWEVVPISKAKALAQCDTCTAPISQYQHKKGKGLCKDCIRNTN